MRRWALYAGVLVCRVLVHPWLQTDCARLQRTRRPRNGPLGCLAPNCSTLAPLWFKHTFKFNPQALKHPVLCIPVRASFLVAAVFCLSRNGCPAGPGLGVALVDRVLVVAVLYLLARDGALLLRQGCCVDRARSRQDGELVVMMGLRPSYIALLEQNQASTAHQRRQRGFRVAQVTCEACNPPRLRNSRSNGALKTPTQVFYDVLCFQRPLPPLAPRPACRAARCRA